MLKGSDGKCKLCPHLQYRLNMVSRWLNSRPHYHMIGEATKIVPKVIEILFESLDCAHRERKPSSRIIIISLFSLPPLPNICVADSLHFTCGQYLLTKRMTIQVFSHY